MSLAIQKKKFGKSAAPSYNKDLEAHERQDYLYQQYLKTFEAFEANFQKNSTQGNLKNLKTILETFYKSLKNDELLITDLAKHEDSLTKSHKDIFLIKRASTIVHILADYLVNRRSDLLKNKKTIDFLDKSTTETRETTVMVVKILKLFAMINPTFAKILSHWPGLTETLLQLILQDNKLYFKQVLSILEALIASNATTITPEMYPLIQEILASVSRKYFARFSRIIALFVLENSEKTDFRELPYDFCENKMIRIHSFVLGIPNLLENYFQVLEHLKEIIQCLTSTTAENILKTITYLKDSKIIRDSGLNLSFLKPLFEQCQISDNLISEIFTPKFITKFIVKKSNITEILFILSNLLTSKRKIDIQNKMRQLDFFKRVIDPMFDILFHPDLGLENADDLAGNEYYCNNPLTTTRIQLLRIIINFCDRDSPNIHNKELMISQEEKDLLYSQYIEPAVTCHSPNSEHLPINPDNLAEAISEMELTPQNGAKPFFVTDVIAKNAFENVKEKGLLNKMIILLKRFNANSSYHFWLASCVESFLRGFHFSHQIFVAHTGLLHNLMNQIMTQQITKSNNIQISYDLLGEIIKFNKYNIIFIETLSKTFGWSETMFKQVSQNIIDSNVFLRSLLLSYERFNLLIEKEDDLVKKEKILNFKNSLHLFDDLANHSLEWFNLLVEAVEPDLINQDNICCINTALIMALFADQKDMLHRYLDSLLTQERYKKKTPIELLNNFKKVLLIWQRYYLSKTKDSFSLQYTTSIKFRYFHDIKRKIEAFLDSSPCDQPNQKGRYD